MSDLGWHVKFCKPGGGWENISETQPSMRAALNELRRLRIEAGDTAFGRCLIVVGEADEPSESRELLQVL